MKIETINRAIILLSTCFQGQKFEAEIFYEFLKELQDDPFLKSVVEICKTQKEIYPNTNIIAILRDRTIELSKKPNQLKLPSGERWATPPTEWMELKKKLGLTL